MKPGIYGFHGPFRFLSNFYLLDKPIEYEGIEYWTSEHAYMASKTTDISIRLKFSQIEKPGAVKRAGQAIELRDNWHQIKFHIMVDILILKFENPILRQQLLNTNDLYLEETNMHNDIVWGVCNGIGENNLGKILMNIRTAFRN